MRFRIALAQINTTVGDLAGNRARIAEYMERARRQGAALVVFPELALTGYPPEDLLLRTDFIEAALAELRALAPASAGLTAVVGALWAEKDLYNAAVVLHDGRLAGVYRKRYLPNYGVFDEERYFRAGNDRTVFSREGAVFGVTICEDIWYPAGPGEEQAEWGQAQLLVNLSASPFYRGKWAERERMLGTRASDHGVFLAYCNLVGGQDELVFDGHSVICSPRGEVIARAPQFEEALLVADLDLAEAFRRRLVEPRGRKAAGCEPGRAHGDPAHAAPPFTRVELPRPANAAVPDGESGPGAAAPPAAPPVAPTAGPVEEVYGALVLALRDYVRKNGFQRVALGLSGGIDSSLTAVIAADALGPEQVLGVAMPTRYSSSHSLEDARALAQNLGIRYLELNIDGVFQSFLDVLRPAFGEGPHGVAEENLQPRIRGTVLMALSNRYGYLVLTCGNKSEIGVGYSTLYGDTAGGFAVLKDVNKLLVYELSRYRNAKAGYDLIPRRVLEKPPSAELRPGQKDTDSLPDYAVLDPVLLAYVEEGISPAELIRRGFDADAVRRVVALVHRNEYKRRQSPPGPKVTPRSFGRDWRMPITNRFRP